MQNDSPDFSRGEEKGERTAVLIVWLALAAVLCGLAAENTFLPGLYYDEAIFGGLAKDFVTGPPHGQHMPNTEVVMVFGHPFPVFVQSYLGAVKSWLLIPAVALFGPSVPVLRLVNLCWSVTGLLFFMLWTWRIAGLAVALAAGALLTLDPAFFFTSILDWGAAAPSFFFRCVGFLFVVRAWEKGEIRDALLAGLCFGLGFFNKVDFAILLLSAAAGALAVVAFYHEEHEVLNETKRPFLRVLRALRGKKLPAWTGLGFLLGGGLMFLHAPKILAVHAPPRPGEWKEKLHILQMMWDGSYFFRLMTTGGQFDTLSATAASVWTPFGLVLTVAVAALAAGIFRRGASAALSTFLLLTFLLVTTGFMLLPGAVRLHHAFLVLPFPHLIVAAAFTAAWKRWQGGRAVLAAAFAVLLCWQVFAILQTQRLIRATGGRGCWSEAMNEFCREVKNRSDLTIISLDWGFNEQLLFLTDGPRLEEPIWNWINQPPAARSKPPAEGNFIYLFHPDQYSKFDFGAEFQRFAPPGGKRLSIQTWRDVHGQPAFYSARFVPKEPRP
jgi:hypothetical protein